MKRFIKNFIEDVKDIDDLEMCIGLTPSRGLITNNANAQSPDDYLIRFIPPLTAIIGSMIVSVTDDKQIRLKLIKQVLEDLSDFVKTEEYKYDDILDEDYNLEDFFNSLKDENNEQTDS